MIDVSLCQRYYKTPELFLRPCWTLGRSISNMDSRGYITCASKSFNYRFRFLVAEGYRLDKFRENIADY